MVTGLGGTTGWHSYCKGGQGQSRQTTFRAELQDDVQVIVLLESLLAGYYVGMLQCQQELQCKEVPGVIIGKQGRRLLTKLICKWIYGRNLRMKRYLTLASCIAVSVSLLPKPCKLISFKTHCWPSLDVAR